MCVVSSDRPVSRLPAGAARHGEDEAGSLLLELEFGRTSLSELRRAVQTHAAAGISRERVHDVVIAVNELTANAVRHEGGRRLRIWCQGGMLHCQVEAGGGHYAAVGCLRWTQRTQPRVRRRAGQTSAVMACGSSGNRSMR